VRRVRSTLNGNVLRVVDGEPQGSDEIRREAIEPLVGLGLFESVEEDAPPERTGEILTPEAPLLTAAHAEPKRTRGRPRKR
jgi:hypothetical protein